MQIRRLRQKLISYSSHFVRTIGNHSSRSARTVGDSSSRLANKVLNNNKIKLNPSIVSTAVLISLIIITVFLSLKSEPTPPAKANNISATNVTVVTNAGTHKATITFSVNWDNSYALTYDGQPFADYAWIFIKYSTSDGSDGSWTPATLASGGTVTPSSDNKGAFISPGNSQTVVWDYNADGVTNGSTAKLRIGAIEMVKIPTGQYYYDVGGIGSDGHIGGGAETIINSASVVPTGASLGWPNGYNSFYIAKYEISQGQYVDFLNTISSADALNRWPNSYNSTRNTINYNSNNPYGSRYSTITPNRGDNFLSHDDAFTYMAWAGMRPMTEMEFEKAGRGTSIGSTNKSVYPWGADDPSTTGYATYSWDGATFSKYYANFNNTSGGPADVGHYLSADITRTNVQTGASVYGVTDLSGNDWEQIINTGWTTTPLNGNGTTTIPASWPTYLSGFGLRGGGWPDGAADLRVSDRSVAAWATSTRDDDVGARPARTN